MKWGSLLWILGLWVLDVVLLYRWIAIYWRRP